MLQKYQKRNENCNVSCETIRKMESGVLAVGQKMDIEGKRFGKLTVLAFAGKSGCGHNLWKCSCDCGKETIVTVGHLRSGHTKSCGCGLRESASKSHKTHGLAGTRLYSIWSNIKWRCESPKAINYERYGGRGITVCEEWKRNFEPFKEWAFANGYKEDLTIERKDNNAGYSPENCHWATAKEQGNNKRNNHLIEINGEIKTMAQWCEQYGKTYSLVNQRINRLDWPPLVALTTPSKREGGRYERAV